MRKRRAGRGPGGSRKEVVIVAGAMHSPVTRSIVLDLERRGFIVYVIVDNVEEADMVKSEGKADILPLKMNVTDVSNAIATSTEQEFARERFPPSLVRSRLLSSSSKHKWLNVLLILVIATRRERHHDALQQPFQHTATGYISSSVSICNRTPTQIQWSPPDPLIFLSYRPSRNSFFRPLVLQPQRKASCTNRYS